MQEEERAVQVRLEIVAAKVMQVMQETLVTMA
jgi:hypothetical protein